MPFGAFCPLPLRLGGISTEGWSAAQHARMAADVAAMMATASLCTFTVDTSTGAISTFEGLWGTGSANAPTVVVNSTGNITITFADSYEDEFERDFPLSIRGVCASPMTADRSTQGLVLTPSSVQIRAYSVSGAAAADSEIAVTIEGNWQPPVQPGDYDGALDKRDCDTEVTPYAWTWYQELTAAMGSMFSESTTSLVHCLKLALARREGHGWRAAERTTANATPNACDELLGQWRRIVGTDALDGEPRQLVRERVAGRFVAPRGNDRTTITALVKDLLGDLFGSITWHEGADLDTPTDNTFFDAGTPGPFPLLAWRYDDSASSFTDITPDVRSTSSVPIYNAPVQVNDAIYLGFARRFKRAVVDYNGGGANGTVAWEYWNGSMWSALSDLVDDSGGFNGSPLRSGVVWTLPADWATTQVSAGESLYYVRARVTVAHTSTPTLTKAFVCWPLIAGETWRSDAGLVTVTLARPPINSEEHARVYLHMARLLDSRLKATSSYEIVSQLQAQEVYSVTAAVSSFLEITKAFNLPLTEWRPFPSVEAVGDYIAVGHKATFQGLKLDNSGKTAGVGGTVAWEYWNGAWTALAGVTDGTTGFTAGPGSGQSVTWTIPGDWAIQPLNGGESLYYVRARVTGVYSTNPVYVQGEVIP